jgi:hypothetical protein
MTFGYGVEKQGMNLQVWKEYDELFPDEDALPPIRVTGVRRAKSDQIPRRGSSTSRRVELLPSGFYPESHTIRRPSGQKIQS